MKILRYTFICYAALIGMGGSFNAAAQQGSSAENTGGLEEIVVTAQRRAERLQDVPISIVNLGADQLVNADVQDLSGIMNLAPAVRFDAQGPWMQATIRGVGTSLVTTGSGSNIGIYMDGYFVPNPQGADSQLLSVDNIQILKGPQGTLFGRNTTGGAVLVNTLKPSEQTSAVVDAVYGSYASQRYQIYGTTGVTDHLAIDAAAVLSKGDGYFTNILTNDENEGRYENWTARIGLKADFSNAISVLFRYEHQSTDDPTGEEVNTYVQNGQPISLQAIIPGAIVATQPGEVSNPNIPRRPGFTANNDIFQLTPTFDLGFATLTSYSQYRGEESRFYQDSIPGSLPIENIVVPVKDITKSQEFLLTSKPGTPLQWTAGAYYFNYIDTFTAAIALNGAPSYTPVTGSNTDNISYAGYADVTYQALDKLYLTAGARYTKDEVKDGYYIQAFTNNRVYAPTLTDDKVTPRAVVRYALDEKSNVYASFARGYKAGIYNLGGDSLASVQPESISAYELGYKYAAQALQFNLASYYYQYKDLQVSTYGLGPGNVPIANLTNAANSRIYGLEGDVRYEVVHNLELNASAAYLNAKYTSFPNAPGNAPCFTSPQVCGANYGSAPPVTINATGFEMQRAPEFTSSLGAQYSLNLPRGRLAFSGHLYYTSKYYEDSAHDIEQPAYATLGLRAEWTDPSGRLTVAVYGDNVTDRRFIAVEYIASQAWGIAWNAPAMVFGEIKVRY